MAPTTSGREKPRNSGALSPRQLRLEIAPWDLWRPSYARARACRRYIYIRNIIDSLRLCRGLYLSALQERGTSALTVSRARLPAFVSIVVISAGFVSLRPVRYSHLHLYAIFRHIYIQCICVIEVIVLNFTRFRLGNPLCRDENARQREKILS